MWRTVNMATPLSLASPRQLTMPKVSEGAERALSRDAQQSSAAHPFISLNLKTVVVATGMTRSRILDAVWKGGLPARKAGRNLVFDPAGVRRWVQSFPLRQAGPVRWRKSAQEIEAAE
jgi:predicted DNA-binding transcriptional regulator AlpA